MSSYTTQAADILARLRAAKPLIHHITNFVVMNDTANITLHIGGSPVMAHAIDEMDDMTGIANALVLNIGTITHEWCEAMIRAGLKANSKNIPVILDPVGAGATALRTDITQRIVNDVKVQIIRGNAGEIGSISGVGGTVRGVDSVGDAGSPIEMARHIANISSAITVVTDKRDIISDGMRSLAVDNGHEWLTTLTGTGCMATSVIAAFAAVEKDYVLAAASALAVYGLAAERAAEQATGPASFKIAFLDQIYAMTPEMVAEGARISDV